jgi:arylformamidase
MSKDAAYYESAYNPRVAVPEFNDHFERWKKRAQQAQAGASGRAYTDVVVRHRSDAEARHLSRQRRKPGAARVHPRRLLARSSTRVSRLSSPRRIVERGVTVASINYALCPRVRVQDIVLQVLQACAWLYRNGANFGAPRERCSFRSLCGRSSHRDDAGCAVAEFAPDLPKKVVQAASR